MTCECLELFGIAKNLSLSSHKLTKTEKDTRHTTENDPRKKQDTPRTCAGHARAQAGGRAQEASHLPLQPFHVWHMSVFESENDLSPSLARSSCAEDGFPAAPPLRAASAFLNASLSSPGLYLASDSWYCLNEAVDSALDRGMSFER